MSVIGPFRRFAAMHDMSAIGATADSHKPPAWHIYEFADWLARTRRK
jgi:hypothetical protein